MIILYIPFPQNNAGDLPRGAAIWQKNHALHSTEEIKIIYHQESFNDEDIPVGTTVYILAHGDKTNPRLLYNQASSHNATSVSTQDLAARFDFDFLVIINRIKAIHLYCCGEKDKNGKIAVAFQNTSIRATQKNIHYYHGMLATPDKDGNIKSKLDDERLIEIKPESIIKNSGKFEKGLKRLNVKKDCYDLKQARAKRIQVFFHRDKKFRERRILDSRKNCSNSQSLKQNSDFFPTNPPKDTPFKP